VNSKATQVEDEPRPDTADRAASNNASQDSLEDHSRVIADLFRAHNGALVSFLAARLHNAQDARDVAQEAYVRLLQLDAPGALSFLRGYLFKIAENLAIDRIRHRALRERAAYTEGLLFGQLDETSSPERNLLAQEELSRISARLMELPANCRQGFIMHVLLDRPTKDIAAEMDVSDRMVRNYVTRGLLVCQAVRDEMKRT
jgi:RNA polymerase sigma-70 factor (ECF subfamily)